MIKKGTVLQMTSGEYDGYKTVAIVKVLRNVDMDTIIAEYVSCHPQALVPFKTDIRAFQLWLLEQKHLFREIKTTELYIGVYSVMPSEKGMLSGVWPPRKEE